MPIAIHNNSKTIRFAEEPFKDEDELQACLERSPYLLVSESEPNVISVKREIILPWAGKLDLLLVDQEGLPIAVEVKLARNAQSRREVVAQAYDYLSDLSKLTYDELDNIADGALTGAVNDLVGAELSIAVQKKCATNLRSGRIRLIIAVDTAVEDLIRIVRYISDHSDIDVSLVSISKFQKGGILVPRVIVARTGKIPGFGSRPRNQLDPVFSSVINAYDKTSEGKWHTRGHARNYRLIYPDEWSAEDVHFEFADHKNKVGVELHLESAAMQNLVPQLSSLSNQKLTDELVLNWDPRWFKSRGGLGRLFAEVGKDRNPNIAVSAMQALISLTRPKIEKYLKV